MRKFAIIFGLITSLLLGACELLLFLPTENSPLSYDSVRFVKEGEIVELTSGISTSSGSNALIYSWRQTGGPGVTLEALKSGAARFVAPPVGDDQEKLTFHVKVERDSGSARERTFAVVVEPDSTAN